MFYNIYFIRIVVYYLLELKAKDKIKKEKKGSPSKYVEVINRVTEEASKYKTQS